MHKGRLNIRFIKLFIVVFIIFSAVQVLAQDQKIEKAKELFETFIFLSESFNMKVADLYSDKAIIKNNRHYPSGEIKTMTMPAPSYKWLIRASMQLARAKGDVSTFSDITYSSEGNRVRINATRYSKLKEYSSPYFLLVGEGESGNWLIFEETVETKP